MKRLLLVCIFGGSFSAAVAADDPYNAWLDKQNQRGMKIEKIRVASEKPLVATEEGAEVTSILQEIEMLENEVSSKEETEESS